MALTKRLTEGEKRRLAVAADCDPRTIVKVLAGAAVRSMAGERARRVLEAEGLLPPLERVRP